MSVIVFSRLSDRYPMKPLLCIGLAICGFSSVTGFFISDFTQLLIVRIVQAIGAASVPALSYAYAAREVGRTILRTISEGNCIQAAWHEGSYPDDDISIIILSNCCMPLNDVYNRIAAHLFPEHIHADSLINSN